jgi:uncharacterized membrane protein
MLVGSLWSVRDLLANIAQFREVFNVFIVLIVAFMIYIYALTLVWNLGSAAFKDSGAMLPAIGLLIFAGFMMRRRRAILHRHPHSWTLSSDTVWNATHRLGAVLFMISGVLAFIGGLFGGMTAFWLMFVPIIGSTIFLLVYSYVLYQRETKA